jgi:dienelactone hydrolase
LTVSSGEEQFFAGGGAVEITSEQAERGVTEQDVCFEVEGGTVPGVIWRPTGADGPRPVILIGHGGTQHKRVPNVVGLARGLVRHQGYACVAIDAPGHGDRITDPEAAEAARRRLGSRLAGTGSGSRPMAAALSPDQQREMQERSTRGVGEWKSVVDAVEADKDLCDGRFGYWGLSMGTAIGLPFVASEPRVQAAVLGLLGLGDRPAPGAFADAAAALRVPVLFIFQWDDELMTRESGVALFDAIGSTDKSMHVNPGGHVEVPRFERLAAEHFYLRTLGPVDAAVAAAS